MLGISSRHVFSLDYVASEEARARGGCMSGDQCYYSDRSGGEALLAP